MNKDRDILYCCHNPAYDQVSAFKYVQTDGGEPPATTGEWSLIKEFPRYENDHKELILQLKLDQYERFLMATSGNGFVLWDLVDDEFTIDMDKAIYLALPHSVRNISTKMIQSNSIMISLQKTYAIAGVRKSLYVWCMKTRQLMKVLDAHFGRIIQLESLTIGNWNSVVTSSIDRSVKVWNLNNIFEQVHAIDRHELQIDSIR
jgi:NACHT domain- and WD repeat-containing protein